MEPVFELRDHAKIPTTAANRPEQIRIRLRAGLNLFSIQEDDLGRNDVVACRSIHRHQLAFPTAERKSGDAYIRTATGWRGKTEFPRRLLHILHQGTGLDPRYPLLGVDVHTSHTRQIENHAAFANSEPSAAVASSPHCKGQVVSLSKVENAWDVGSVGTASDHCGMLIECAVENKAC